MKMKKLRRAAGVTAAAVAVGGIAAIGASASDAGKAGGGDIAKIKMPDINANDIDAAKKIIAGTARSMGVEVDA